MLRRLVFVLALATLALSTPALAASKSKSAKPAATKSAKSKKAAAKKKVAAPTPTPAPAESPIADASEPALGHRADPDGRTFIRTQRAGWQEVVVGNKVVATRADGSKVTGTIREVSDFAIVIEPKETRQVTIAAGDLNQVFAAH